MIEPYYQEPFGALYHGDALTILKQLPDNFFHCCVTSPPYFGLREYGTAKWDGGDVNCDHIQIIKKNLSSGLRNDGRIHKGLYENEKSMKISKQYKDICGKCGAKRVDLQIGVEKTPEEYILRLTAIFHEVKRVLHPSGTFWLVIGDSYAGSGKGIGSNPDPKWEKGRNDELKHKTNWKDVNCKAKDLLEIPSDLVRELKKDGWYLRSRIPWIKRNPLPENTDDRPTSAIEYVFLLTKSRNYYYDYEAVKIAANYDGRQDTYMKGSDKYSIPIVPGDKKQSFSQNPHERWPLVLDNGQPARAWRNSDLFFQSWQGLLTDAEDPLAFVVNTSPFRGGHYAVFPMKLIEPIIRAGTSEKGCCPKCGEFWIRIVEKQSLPRNDKRTHSTADQRLNKEPCPEPLAGHNTSPISKTVGWQPGCKCGINEVNPCIVLDPFIDSGTTACMAKEMNREWMGIELNQKYLDDITISRIKSTFYQRKLEI